MRDGSRRFWRGRVPGVLPSDVVQHIVVCYRAGLSAERVARLCRVSVWAVYYYAQKHQRARESRRATIKRIAERLRAEGRL